MFPTLLLLVLALFVVRGCGSWLYHVTVEAGDALLWEGMGRVLPPSEARTKECWLGRAGNSAWGGEQVHGGGPLPLLHLALRAPGDRYTGRVGRALRSGCSSRPSDHFLPYLFSRAEII